MINTKEITKEYLEYMKGKYWPIHKSEKLIDSTFPTCFVISGAVDWFNRKITNNPFSNEAYATYQRVFRHFDEPTRTHQPFFWMLLDTSWNLYPREKVIEDNFRFATEVLGLDSNRLKITYWKGGKVYGDGINPSADIEGINRGNEFERMKNEGIFIGKDEEAINTWKKLGIKDEQLSPVGETGGINDDRDAILLNAREHFAGVRTEPYYLIGSKKEWYEIGVFLDEAYIKKTIALKLNIPQEALEDSLSSNKFLLKIKPRVVPGGFGLERIAMAANNLTSVYELEPLKNVKEILMNDSKDVNYEDVEKQTKEFSKSRMSLYRSNLLKTQEDINERIVENISSYLHSLPWLVNDGAYKLRGGGGSEDRQRAGIYRKVLRTIIADMELVNCNNYNSALDVILDFYSDSIEPLGNNLREKCIEEIDKQKKRISSTK